MKQITDAGFRRYQAMCKAAGVPMQPEIKEKWTPPEQDYFFSQKGEILTTITHDMTEIGRERSTKTLCKIASDRTIRANIISAWLDSEGSGEQESPHKTKHLYTIYKNDSGEYVKCLECFYSPDQVYMLEEDAIKLCEVINLGEFEL